MAAAADEVERQYDQDVVIYATKEKLKQSVIHEIESQIFKGQIIMQDTDY